MNSIFAGRIIKGYSYWEYRSTIEGGPFCHDFTRHVAGAHPGSKLHRATPSWGGGIADHGAERMAIVLLALSCANSRMDWVTPAKKYYKKYAKEVVAHLPDKWRMTDEEIMEWVRKQEEKRRKK